MKIILTGSSSGIGRFLTTRLVKNGHSVWGVSRSDQASLQAELSSSSGEFQFSRCDVSSWDSISLLAHDVEKKWGQIDAVICGTGIQGKIGPAMSLDPKEWQNTVRVNLEGTFLTIRALYRLLNRSPQKRAKVVCFSGGGGTSSRPHFSAYAVAKTGIVRFVEVAADEWAEEFIDINAIAPGAISTNMTQEIIDLGPDVVGKKEYESALKTRETGGSSLEKVLGLIQFLLSNDSNGITGRLISAPWDPWEQLKQSDLASSEAFKLRRVLLEAKKN